MQKRTVILHGHIFKNAGTTFDWSLKRNFGEGFVDHREDKDMRRQGADYLLRYLEERPGIVALSSHHLCCPLPVSEAFDFVPIFMLRHPIERIWSVYQFERRQKSDSPGARRAKELDLKRYALWRMQDDVNPAIRNYQTAGRGFRKRPRTLPRPERICVTAHCSGSWNVMTRLWCYWSANSISAVWGSGWSMLRRM